MARRCDGGEGWRGGAGREPRVRPEGRKVWNWGAGREPRVRPEGRKVWSRGRAERRERAVASDLLPFAGCEDRHWGSLHTSMWLAVIAWHRLPVAFLAWALSV